MQFITIHLMTLQNQNNCSLYMLTATHTSKTARIIKGDITHHYVA